MAKIICEKCKDEGTHHDGDSAEIYCDCLLGEALNAVEMVEVDYHNDAVADAQERVKKLFTSLKGA